MTNGQETDGAIAAAIIPLRNIRKLKSADPNDFELEKVIVYLID